MNPEQLTNLEKNKIIEMYSKLNQDLTSKIIKKLESNGDISSYTKSQIKELAKQGGKEIFYETLKESNKISKSQKKELEKLFKEVQTNELGFYETTFKTLDKKLKLTPQLVKLTNTIYKKTNKQLKNITKTIAFQNKQTYVKAIDELYLKVATGSQDYTTAIKSTVNKLAEKGVILKSKGREYKLESVVKMNLMTSLTQTANNMSKDIGDIIGANCVVIGHTPSCRPTHRVIDGVIMSIDKFRKYKYLTEEPNCYHVVNYDWREEFENKSNKIIDNGHLTQTQYDKNYEIKQKQNYYARQVREKKEQVTILNKSDKRSSVTQEELKKAKIELRNSQIKYRQYCNSKGLDVDYNLTWKSGYNK